MEEIKEKLDLVLSLVSMEYSIVLNDLYYLLLNKISSINRLNWVVSTGPVPANIGLLAPPLRLVLSHAVIRLGK